LDKNNHQKEIEMTKIMGYFLYFVCAAQFFFALVFFLQLPIAIDLWPFREQPPNVYLHFIHFRGGGGGNTMGSSHRK
jgi:hypothetical protein